MVTIDYTELTQIERDALDAAARRERPDDAEYTGEDHLKANVAAMLGAAVKAYFDEQRPGLESLGFKLLNVSPALRADLIRQLEEAQPAKDTQGAPGGPPELAEEV
ncbi:MAG TPA: hypothetical protein VF668_01465 [Pyrinomonadaceae bacterium]|jgi:hypothetical protein